MAKDAKNITPKVKFSGGAWRDIPSFVSQISTNKRQMVTVYHPINCTTPTFIKTMASPTYSWEIVGVCTSTTDFGTVDASFVPGTEASLKCSTATPGVSIIITDLSWEEEAGPVNLYRYTLTVEKT